MTMHVLYGYPRTGSVVAECALAWAGVPYQQVRAASWVEDSAVAELARVNPLSQVPTLVLPDGTVLSESAAILIHLGLAYPESGLLPTDPARRATVLRGLLFITANCYAAVGVMDYPERWLATPDEAVHAQLGEGARQALLRYWAVFADTFPGAPFLSGAEPAALDILAVVAAKWNGAPAWIAEHLPAFAALLARVEAHERIRPVLQGHWPSAGIAD
ncbi:glutathione S-transferase family protein [Neisseriaceae bacterium JH1-16]|nr:glutathione S-transferase family protein [Neisseriaceae bacterium JH1-16]